MCISLDGYITRPDGYPVQLADPSFKPGQSHGFPEFQESCEAVLMGRTTFEPALVSDRFHVGMNDTESHWTLYDSSIGPLTPVARPKGLANLSFPGRLRPPAEASKRPKPDVVEQLEGYFAGERQAFGLPLDLRGTPL